MNLPPTARNDGREVWASRSAHLARRPCKPRGARLRSDPWIASGSSTSGGREVKEVVSKFGVRITWSHPQGCPKHRWPWQWGHHAHCGGASCHKPGWKQRNMSNDQPVAASTAPRRVLSGTVCLKNKLLFCWKKNKKARGAVFMSKICFDNQGNPLWRVAPGKPFDMWWLPDQQHALEHDKRSRTIPFWMKQRIKVDVISVNLRGLYLGVWKCS